MFFPRCRAALLRSSTVRAPAARAFGWSHIRQLQTRGSQNASYRPSKILPRQTNAQPPPPHTQSEPAANESQNTPGNDEQFRYFPDEEPPNVKVRFLVPTIWAVTVSTGIFVSLAYLEAKRELESRNPYRLFEGSGIPTRRASYSTYSPNGPPTPTEVVTRAWREADPMSKLSLGLIGVNGAVHLSGMVARGAWQHLWHIPATNRNYTLFTSTFVHSGPMHLAINMYAMYNFLPAVGYSKLFRADTYHMLSFFLSTGVLSGLAQHVASTVFKQGRPYSAFISSGGASGALFAVFAAFCMEYPTQGVGVILIPYYLEAQYFLPLIMTFDLVGMIRGFKFVSLGHAAHLGGACLGVAYSWLDGRDKVWRPLVDYWKRRLR